MSKLSQPKKGLLIAIAIVVGASLLIEWLAQTQPWAAPLRSLTFALPLAVALALVINAKKSSIQRQDRSRAEDSIERRASERASERTVEVALVILAIQFAALTFWFGMPGALVGFVTLAAVVVAQWVNYGWQLRQATKEA